MMDQAQMRALRVKITRNRNHDLIRLILFEGILGFLLLCIL